MLLSYRNDNERVTLEQQECETDTHPQRKKDIYTTFIKNIHLDPLDNATAAQDNGTNVLATHQLQVQRRESHRANQVYALTHHTSYRWRGERVIEPIKCMRSPHTSYRWRGERVIEPIKCMRSPHTSYRWRGERES